MSPWTTSVATSTSLLPWNLYSLRLLQRYRRRGRLFFPCWVSSDALPQRRLSHALPRGELSDALLFRELSDALLRETSPSNPMP